MCISFMSHGIAVAKHMVKQGNVISFPPNKKIKSPLWILLLYWKLVGEYKDKIINLN